ncbi:MAG: hypothetical protein AAGA56_28730 [Myxococcota bacterium]
MPSSSSPHLSSSPSPSSDDAPAHPWVAQMMAAQRRGLEPEGREAMRRYVQGDLVFFTEVGHRLTQNDAATVASFITMVVGLIVVPSMWGKGMVVAGAVAVAVGAGYAFVRLSLRGAKERFKRQQGIESHGLYLHPDGLLFHQADRNLYVERNAVLSFAVTGVDTLRAWQLVYRDAAGEERRFKLLDADEASREVAAHVERWLGTTRPDSP